MSKKTKYLLRDNEKWTKVINSDESQIEVISNSRVSVRRPIGFKDNPKPARRTVTFTGECLMIYAVSQ